VPLLLAVAWGCGWLLMVAWHALWWLLRAAWWVSWRLAVIGAALLVVTFSRSLAWRLAAGALGAALTGRVRRKGGWGDGLGDERHTANAPGPLLGLPGRHTPGRVKLRPVSAQRVATATYRETRWHTRALDGSGLLSMLIGPAGVGKSEVVWGSLRAGYDGRDFCGLETTRPRRVLLLSEMGGETLQPALRRWGFYVEPAGRLDVARLRLWLPGGSPGALIDVVYAADIYRPVLVDGELRQAEWPAVVEAVVPDVRRGRYDRVIVDSLGEWMGADNNDTLLKTMASCRQLTHAGAGVDLLHHTPRSDPKRPRGGTVIEAKLDIGYSVTGLGAGGAPRSRQDPVRSLEWFKTRFPDQTPTESLLIERAWAGPESGERPRYQRRDAQAAAKAAAVISTAPSDPGSQPSPTLTPPHQAPTGAPAAVLAALVGAGPGGATTKELQQRTGLGRTAIAEAIAKELIPRWLVRTAGTRPPPGGGPPAQLYVAAGAQRPRLRLVGSPTGAESQSAEAEAEGAPAEAPAAIAGGAGGPA
jgi:AAA domain